MSRYSSNETESPPPEINIVVLIRAVEVTFLVRVSPPLACPRFQNPNLKWISNLKFSCFFPPEPCDAFRVRQEDTRVEFTKSVTHNRINTRKIRIPPLSNLVKPDPKHL